MGEIRTRNQLIIQPYERVALVGKTGCGKTTLGKAYAGGFPNVMVLDTKGTFKWGNVPILKTFDKFRKESDTMPGKFIYRPIDKEMNGDYFDAFFEYVYKRRNTVCYVDELAQVADLIGGDGISPNWQNIMQRGRELKVGIFNSTQRPTAIPLMSLSESEHTFCFRLKLHNDRKRMAEFMGEAVLTNRLKQHGFIYMHEAADQAVIMPNGVDIPPERG